MRLIHCPGKGPLIARRVGYAASRGEVLLSLDSDDMLRDDALESINDCFNRYNADVVLFACSRKRDYSGPDLLQPFSKSELFVGKSRLKCMQRLCTSSTLNSMCCKAVKRGCLDLDMDYADWSGLRYAEDLLQSLPIMDCAESVFYLNERLYYYRVNYASSTQRFDPAQVEMRDSVNSIQQIYARKWEKRFNDNTLVKGVKTIGLSSYGDMSQGACEELGLTAAKQFMCGLISRNQFSIYWDGGALSDLRFDIKLLVWLLRRGRFTTVWVISRVKSAIRKMLGR